MRDQPSNRPLGAHHRRAMPWRNLSLRWRLVSLVIGSIVPLLAFNLFLQYWSFEENVANTGKQTLALAHSMSLAVARELEDCIADLQTLASAPVLQASTLDLDEVRRRADALAAQFHGSNVILLQQDGRQLMNTLVPPGKPLPARANLEATRRVFETGLPAVSGIFNGALDGRLVVAVDVPVKRADGSIAYVLSMNPGLETFAGILRRGQLPLQWIAIVLDQHGRIVARIPNPEQFVGQQAALGPSNRLPPDPEGFLEPGKSLEGVEVLRVYSRTAPYDWAVGIGVPLTQLTAPARAEALRTVAVGLALLVISVGHALYAASRIGGPIASLRRFAALRESASTLAPPATGLPEVDEVARALLEVETARRRSREEEQRAQAKFEESEQIAGRIIDSMLDGFVQIDTDGRITAWNPQAETMFGWTRAEMLGTKLHERIMQEEERTPYEEGLARFLAAGETSLIGNRREFDALRRDGTVIRVELTMTALRRRDGSYVFNAFIRDLTQKIATETQLREAQKMEAIGHLTGGMAHDFNNLLVAVILDLEALQAGTPPGSSEHELASEALGAAMRGADLIARLLAFARRQPLHPQRVEPNALIGGIMGLLGRTLGEDIRIDLNLAPDAWPIIVDPAQLETAIVNLANNARDAMPKGGRLIIATANQQLDEEYAGHHPELRSGDYVMIAISDTGIGIAEAAMPRIFEPFYTTKEPGKGTGLGLSMVFGFVKQSGGHVNVYSEEGKGTTFRLYLPRLRPSEQPRDTPSPPQRKVEGGTEAILVVDDNPMVRNVVRRQLISLGYTVREAGDGPAALELLAREPVDLLFSDVVMPGGLDGFELAREAMARWPRLKVLLTSGFPDIRLVTESHGAGVRLLGKPYRKDELAQRLREILDAVPSSA